jgi:hypothetical protein
VTVRSGWAYGELVGSDDWLTIMGSAHRRPVLHATVAEAETALAGEAYRDSPHLDLVVRHVTEVPHGGVSGGWAYRVTTITDEEITKLRGDCMAVGNSPLMLLCCDALGGDGRARSRVAKIVADAAARRAESDARRMTHP